MMLTSCSNVTGAEEYATGTNEPSPRMNQSRSTRTASPVWRGHSSGQSASGNGRPSGRR